MKIRTGKEQNGWFAEASEIPGKPEIVCRGPTEAVAKAKLASYLKTYCGLSMPGAESPADVVAAPEATAAEPKKRGRVKKDDDVPAPTADGEAPAVPSTGEQDAD